MSDSHRNIYSCFRGAAQTKRDREKQLEDNTAKVLVNTLEHCDRRGATNMYVNDVEQTVTFFEAAFGLSSRFIHEGGYAEMDTGDTTCSPIAT